MFKKIFSLTISLVFILSLSGMVLADENYAEQEQYGSSDSATIEQIGSSNTAYQWQNYYQTINGSHNIAEIYQQGNWNTASQVQEGIENQSYITQIGNSNYAGNVDWAGQWQSGGAGWFGIGNRNYSKIYQDGAGNRTAQTTVGDDNEAYITQYGLNNDAGFYGDSELWEGSVHFNAGQRQFGNDNFASIYQDGEGNNAVQRQNEYDVPGHRNTAIIKQYETNSGAYWGEIVGAGQKQFGNDNWAEIYQDGFENYAYSIQTGDGNWVSQSQIGNYNYSIVTQIGNGNSATVIQGGI